MALYCKFYPILEDLLIEGSQGVIHGSFISVDLGAFDALKQDFRLSIP